jgi:hypothetical protein
MFGVNMPYLFAFLVNFTLLAALTAVVVGLTTFLVVRAVRKKRAADKG